MIASLTDIHAETIDFGGHHEGLGAHGIDISLDVRPVDLDLTTRAGGYDLRGLFFDNASGMTTAATAASEIASKAGGIEGVQVLSSPFDLKR